MWFWLGVVCEEACAVWTGVRLYGRSWVGEIAQQVPTIVPPNIHAAPRGLHTGCKT